MSQIYNGLTPGGLSCQSYADGRQRSNDEFADSNSMWGRTVVEGLFGIMPRIPDGIVALSPQFPANWPRAAITTPLFSYEWTRKNGEETISWKSSAKVSVHLRLPVKASEIREVKVNGKSVAWDIEAGVGLTWVKVTTPAGTAGTLGVSYLPGQIPTLPEITIRQGKEFALNLADYGASHYLNPQGIVTGAWLDGTILRGKIKTSAGPGLLFLSSGTAGCPMWLPVRLRIEPATSVPAKIWKAPATNRNDLMPWRLVDLGQHFNFALTDVIKHYLAHAQLPAKPYSEVGYSYRNDHFGSRIYITPDDTAWRAKVGPDGIAWTADGIPFKTNKTGANMAVVSLSEGFPHRFIIPVGERGKTLYLMISGMTFPAQSHVTNFRLLLQYHDGRNETVDLVNPYSIGDCWGTCLGRVHDTAANGFENIAGRYGPAGSCEVGDLTKPVAVDTEAHLVAIPLNSEQTLTHLTFEAIANDIVFGLMGMSLLTV